MALAAALVFGVSTVRAATYWVTVTNDAGPGSLREAISTANSAGGGEVQCAVSGTILLATSLPPLLNVSIICPPTNMVAISGINTNYNVTNGFRLFTIPINSTATLQRLTLMDAYGPSPGGGAILNYGSLILRQCTLTNNKARFGGAIYSEGDSVTLLLCTLSGNQAVGAGGNWFPPYSHDFGESVAGGALFSSHGIVAASDCVFSNNQSLGGDPVGSSSGGALYAAHLALTNSLFKNNLAKGADGAGSSPSYGNGTTGGPAWGGALYIAGPTQIIGCQFLNNGTVAGDGGQGYAGGDGGAVAGGAIAILSGSAILSDSSLIGNYATAGDGGYAIRGGSEGSGGAASAGGLWASNALVTMATCTVAQNTVSGGRGMDGSGFVPIYPGEGGDAQGGGIAISGGSFVGVNTTISSNSVVPGAGGYYQIVWNWQTAYYASRGASQGGGLWASGAVNLTNATVALNAANNTNGLGGGLYGGRIALRNCLLTGNTAVSSPDATNVTSLGFNLFSQTNGMGNLTATDLQSVNVGIGSLQDNGGPTLTHALLPGSPAINAGDSGGITVDQRGYPRPVVYPGIASVSTGEDIGAFELDNAPRMFRPELTSGNVALTFLTVSEGQYRVEYTDTLINPNWRAAMTSIRGNGGGVRVSLSTSGVTNRFYRIVREN